MEVWVFILDRMALEFTPSISFDTYLVFAGESQKNDVSMAIKVGQVRQMGADR